MVIIKGSYFEIRERAEARSPKKRYISCFLFTLRIYVLLLFILAVTTLMVHGQEDEPEHPFRFAFSSALLGNVNENDARASMKAWAEMLVHQGTVRGDPNVLYCNDVSTMLTALQNRQVDGIAALVSEYTQMQGKVKFNRCVVNFENGTIFKQYVILVHANSGLTQIEDLRGRTLNIQQNSRMSLAIPWLDTLLLEKGLEPAQGFCGRIAWPDTLSKTVLPVFFRQTDVCIATLEGFKTMGELNPQVSKQLRVLATSPGYVIGGFFFRAGYPQIQQDQFVNEMTHLHNNPAGKQVLTVFQTERLEEYPVSVLDSSIGLLETHRRLIGGKNSPKSAAIISGNRSYIK